MRGLVTTRLGGVFSGLGGSIARFPLPLACALAAAVCMAINRPGVKLSDSVEDALLRLTIAAVIGFFLALGVALIAERRGWPFWQGPAVSAIGLALLAAKMFWDEPELGLRSASIIFLGPAAVLFAATAPFLPGVDGRVGGRTGDDDAFWEFNKTAWLACLLGFAAALALSIGGASGLLAIEYLFDLNFRDRPYWYLNVFAFSVVCPWLALSGMPRKLDAPEKADMPRWLAILTTYILVPLGIVYLVILYVYIGWIVALWDLPRGRVAYIVAGCVVYGILVHMAAYPLRQSGAWLVRLYHRIFYPALAGPVLLMGVGLVRRIDTYGVTEGRYAVAVLALWLAAMTVLHIAPFRRRLVWVPLSVAVPLLLASFGPWGAFSVSQADQMGRLERLLTAGGILKDGKLTPVKKRIAGASARQITSIVDYLRDTGKLEAIRPWMVATKEDFGKKRPSVKTIVEALGVKYAWSGLDDDTFNIENSDLSNIVIWGNLRNRLIGIEGYNLIGFVDRTARDKERWQSYKGSKLGKSYRVSLNHDTGRFRVNGPDAKGSVVIDLKPIAAKLRRMKAREHHKHMVIDAKSRTMRVRLMIMALHGKDVGTETRVTVLRALILIGDGTG